MMTKNHYIFLAVVYFVLVCTEVRAQEFLTLRKNKVTHLIMDHDGKYSLKIWMVDPRVMLDGILMDSGEWKSSYSFPLETKIPSLYED